MFKSKLIAVWLAFVIAKSISARELSFSPDGMKLGVIYIDKREDGREVQLKCNIEPFDDKSSGPIDAISSIFSDPQLCPSDRNQKIWEILQDIVVMTSTPVAVWTKYVQGPKDVYGNAWIRPSNNHQYIILTCIQQGQQCKLKIYMDPSQQLNNYLIQKISSFKDSPSLADVIKVALDHIDLSLLNSTPSPSLLSS